MVSCSAEVGWQSLAQGLLQIARMYILRRLSRVHALPVHPRPMSHYKILKKRTRMQNPWFQTEPASSPKENFSATSIMEECLVSVVSMSSLRSVLVPFLG